MDLRHILYMYGYTFLFIFNEKYYFTLILVINQRNIVTLKFAFNAL